MPSAKPASRRQQFIWGLRYYGFVGGLIALIVIVLSLTVLVLTEQPQTEEELTAEDVRRLESQRGLRPLTSSGAALQLDPVSVSIETSPSGAELRIDGEDIGSSPMAEVQLRPGYYLLSISHPDYPSRDTLLEVLHESAQTVSIALDGARPVTSLAARESASNLPEVAARRQNTAPPPARTQEHTSTPSTSRSEQPTPPAPTPRESRESVVRTGALAVVAEPSDARVILDGQPAGTTPIVMSDVAAGEHEVLVHAPGYVASSQIVSVEAGQQATVRVTLQALEGTLSVLARPWGSIYVNGNLVKRDTDVLYSAPLPSGFHTIRVVHPVLGEQEQTVEVRAGLTTRVVFELENN